MQEVNDLVFVFQVVHEMDQVPELLSHRGEFVVAFFVGSVEELVNQKILAVIDDHGLDLSRLDGTHDPAVLGSIQLCSILRLALSRIFRDFDRLDVGLERQPALFDGDDADLVRREVLEAVCLAAA